MEKMLVWRGTMSSHANRSGCLATLFKLVCFFVLILIILVFVSSFLNGSRDSSLSPRRTSVPEVTADPTATAEPGDVVSWATYYASKYQTRDIVINDVLLIDSSTLGDDICFIVDVHCDHSNTKLQFSHLNEVMINICQAMSSRDHFDCVSFTVYDTFVDKYGNTQRIVSITASYKVATLRRINYDHHMSYKYSTPTAFISCADSHYIHTGYNLK